MGFRTLAIEKRSSEVWTLLSAVKTEFGKFGDILDKTQKKLQRQAIPLRTQAESHARSKKDSRASRLFRLRNFQG